VVESEPFLDHRGFFVRTMSAATLAEAGIDIGMFVEESQSRSGKGVLRGLHGRAALSEGKLVRCASGRVFEVIGSQTRDHAAPSPARACRQLPAELIRQRQIADRQPHGAGHEPSARRHLAGGQAGCLRSLLPAD